MKDLTNNTNTNNDTDNDNDVVMEDVSNIPNPPIPQQQQQVMTPRRNVRSKANSNKFSFAPPIPQQQQQANNSIFSSIPGIFSQGYSTVRNAFTNASRSTTSLPTELQHPPKGKPVDENKSLVAMLVDRSGSMASMGSEVSGGCNTYLDDQRKADKENGTSTHVIFSVFDSTYDRVRNGPLSQQTPITDAEVAPRGSTALYDSIAQTISDTIEHLNKLEVVPDTVGVFILTDGHENASHTWTAARIKEQIKLLEGEPYKWEFYFAAANQDAMKTGAGMGVKASQCVSYAYDAGHMKSAFQSASSAFVRQKRHMSSSFTPQERSACYH